MNPFDFVGIARKLIELVLDLVSPDEAAQLLTEEAVRRQNAIADAAEVGKFAVIPAVKAWDE